MTSLIACLGTGKGTWSYVIELIAKEDWDKVFLITSQFGKEQFQIKNEKIVFIVIDEKRHLKILVEDIYRQLKGKLEGFEAAVNLISGTGKEHMAVISAVLRLGLAMRLVGVDEKGVDEI